MGPAPSIRRSAGVHCRRSRCRTSTQRCAARVRARDQIAVATAQDQRCIFVTRTSSQAPDDDERTGSWCCPKAATLQQRRPRRRSRSTQSPAQQFDRPASLWSRDMKISFLSSWKADSLHMTHEVTWSVPCFARRCDPRHDGCHTMPAAKAVLGIRPASILGW